MWDYTIEYHQQCAESKTAEFSVGGYHQHIDAQYGVVCSCKGYQFRKTCKHSKQVEKSLCGWHSMFSEEIQTPEQENNHICPCCGGKTETVRVAV